MIGCQQRDRYSTAAALATELCIDLGRRTIISLEGFDLLLVEVSELTGQASLYYEFCGKLRNKGLKLKSSEADRNILRFVNRGTMQYVLVSGTNEVGKSSFFNERSASCGFVFLKYIVCKPKNYSDL